MSVKIAEPEKPLARKLFAAFETLNDSPAAGGDFYNRPAVKKITGALYARYSTAVNECKNAACLVSAFLITEEEQKLLVENFRASFMKDGTKTPGISAQHFAGDLKAANYIINAYLGSIPLRYPKIDGGDFATAGSETMNGYLQDMLRLTRSDLKQESSKSVFFALPMLAAVHILRLNNRDEATRYEPITGGINANAFARVATIDYSKFPYAAILVPGLGPSTAGVALDPGGAKRCELAAGQYRKGIAPFIIVSGGHVHPNKTPFSEGVEMKRYLVDKLKVPAASVIVEPYARHTTTNVRNGARIIYNFGLPASKPVLIVSDAFQSTYIMMMKARFMDELGYLPYKQLGQSQDRKPWFVPDSSALQPNPFDPLDP